MSPEMLAKVTALVEAGAVVVGKPPRKAPGLTGYPESDEKVKKMAEALWGTGSEKARVVGQGKVFNSDIPAEVLADLGIKPDFQSTAPMNFIHRSVNGAEIYFIASQEQETTDIVCSFRVTGMIPESWDAVTGKIQPVSVFEDHDGVTRIPLRFEPSGSRFIVFKSGRVPDTDRIVSAISASKELAGLDLPVKMVPEAEPPVAGISNFTMAAWVNPEIEISLPEEANKGTNGLSGERNDVIYPAPAHEVWTNKDAGAGFGVGTNGIGVYEHTENYLPAVLVYPVPVTGWTHVAVVYRNNSPSLWINGKKVRDGMKGPWTVHGGLGATHTRRVKSFIGQVTAIKQFSKALDSNELLQLYLAAPDTASMHKEEPVIDLMAKEIYQNGTYLIKTADGNTRTVLSEGLPAKTELTGPWELNFTPGWGAPEKVTLEKLISWNRHANEGVRYYSGSAVYKKTFQFELAPETGKNLQRAIYLDLGRVAVMAEVKLNGKSLGILWRPPYKAEITEVLQNGSNELEIRVVNLMVNRMIGDEQLPDDSERKANGTLKSWPQWLGEGKPSPTGRYTFTSWRLWAKDSPLQTSGLLGPVTIQTALRF
jgi:hypothetical protein